jgi:hypothetical protein
MTSQNVSLKTAPASAGVRLPLLKEVMAEYCTPTQSHESRLGPRVEHHEFIAKTRVRVERCRRLARVVDDERAARELNAMASEGGADIARLLAENDD